MALDTMFDPGQVPAVADGTSRITVQQAARLHDQLIAQWHEQVAAIIEVSLLLHDAPDSSSAVLIRRDSTTRRTVRRLAGAHRSLAETEEALERLTRRTYGCCTVCASPIPFERLEAHPAAARCPRCDGTAEGSS